MKIKKGNEYKFTLEICHRSQLGSKPLATINVVVEGKSALEIQREHTGYYSSKCLSVRRFDCDLKKVVRLKSK